MMDPSLSDRAKVHAREAIALVENAYADARDVVHSFRAAGTAEKDFPRMFEAYVRDFSARTGIRTRWDVEEEHLAELSPDAVLQISRVMGEALSNVRKHARAHTVSLSSSLADTDVVISIEDDGIGFDPADVPGEPQGHFGLKVMAERASLAGGSLHIEASSPHGTLVRLSIPRGSH